MDNNRLKGRNLWIVAGLIAGAFAAVKFNLFGTGEIARSTGSWVTALVLALVAGVIAISIFTMYGYSGNHSDEDTESFD